MAMIFDLDGTIINSFEVHVKLVKEAMDEVLGHDTIPISIIRKNIRLPSKELFLLIEKRLGIKISPVKMKKIIEIKDNKFDEDQIKKIKFYPKAKELLLLLKNKRAKFCIATSMNKTEFSRINPFIKIEELCDVVTAPALKHEQPDPYIINKAMRIIKSKVSETFYIGDAETDFMASNNAGTKFIGVNNPELFGKGNKYFKDINALYNFVRKDYSYFL